MATSCTPAPATSGCATCRETGRLGPLARRVPAQQGAACAAVCHYLDAAGTPRLMERRAGARLPPLPCAWYPLLSTHRCQAQLRPRHPAVFARLPLRARSRTGQPAPWEICKRARVQTVHTGTTPGTSNIVDSDARTFRPRRCRCRASAALLPLPVRLTDAYVLRHEHSLVAAGGRGRADES